MPFDVRDFPAPGGLVTGQTNRQLLAAWIFVIAGMILVMIGLGGTTRLSGSGLSIMEWAPLMGALPPLSEGEWHRLFGLYQRIPQYQLVNQGFGLEGFKQIFWLEWTHRLWGRLIGLAVAIPLIWFMVTGRMERWLLPRVVLLLALGGLQGAVGWLMVASGFQPDATSVSPYRLVVHLALAVLLYSTCVWTGLALLPRGRSWVGRTPVLAWLARLVCLLISITIVAGGFVAGLHAGLDYNTFPLMDGQLIPSGYGALRPFILNWTENVAAVQFNHRLLATLTLASVVVTLVIGSRIAGSGTEKMALTGLGIAVALQYSLGVATLIHAVPMFLATAHQVCAFLLLTASLVLMHASRQAAPVTAPG